MLRSRGELWRLAQTEIEWEADESLATPEQRVRTYAQTSKTRADREGCFRLENVSVGVPLVLGLENPFGPPCSVSVEPLLEGEVRSLEIELPRGALITGIVLDQDGLPVHDAHLRVSAPRQTVRQIDEDTLQDPVAYSGEDGRFRIEKVKRAKRQLSIDGPFRRVGTMEVDATHGDVLDLVIRVDRGVELEMTVRWPDGTPVERFSVKLSWANPPNQHGKDGRCVVRGLEPGTQLNLEIDAMGEAAGRGSAVRSVVLPSPPIEIVLGAEGTSDVTVRLVDRDGEDLEGSVSIYGPLDGTPTYCSAPDHHSPYVFQDLPAGEWLVSAKPFGSQEIESRITLYGQPLELKLDVLPTARVSGTVRDASGRPVEGAVVGDETGVFTAQFFEREDDKTDRDGRFSIVPDAFDSRIVAVASGHGSSTPLALRLAPGEHLRDVELQLLPGCRLTATVLDVDGEPVPGAWVEALTPERITSHRQADSNGAVRFEDLPPGLFLIGVRHPDYAANQKYRLARAELSPDLDLKVELRFHRSDPVRVHGRIELQEDTTGAAVHLLTRGFDALFELDAEGRFAGILPSTGRWRGRLQLPGESGSSPVRCVEFLVPDVEEHEVVVQLDPSHVRNSQEFLRWIVED